MAPFPCLECELVSDFKCLAQSQDDFVGQILRERRESIYDDTLKIGGVQGLKNPWG